MPIDSLHSYQSVQYTPVEDPYKGQPVCYTRDTYTFGMIPIGAFPEIYREYPENMYKVNPYLVLKYNRDWVIDNRPDLHGINEAIALLPPLFDGMSRKKMAHALAISPNLAWVVNDSWLFDRYRHTHDNIVQNQFTCDTGLVDAQIKRVQVIVARMEKAEKIMAKMHD